MMRNLSRSRYFYAAALVAACATFSLPRNSQAGSLVTIATSLGDIKVDLFDDVAPGTVQNFVNLLTADRYDNTIIHRTSVKQDNSPFVIQGGGFNLSWNMIANNGNIPLEYKIKNTRGTISMARSTAANSANSQWFISTGDNTTVLGNGPGGSSPDGYAVFGWVVSGMNVVDAIQALPRYNFGSPFNELPLTGYTQADYQADKNPENSNKVIVSSISIAETHPSFQNPIWDADVNNDGDLSSSDLMPIINRLLAHSGRFTPAAADINDTYFYYDTSGDNQVSVSDLMRVVNAILLNASPPAASPQAAPIAMPMAVPEPSTFALVAMAIVATVTVAIRRRSRDTV